MQDDDVTLPGGLSLPDPRPAYVPAGFDPFPDHALRGVSQPVGPGAPMAGDPDAVGARQTEHRMRQYIRGLMNGRVPASSANETTDFLQHASRLRVQVCAWSARQSWFEASTGEASEIDGFPARYWSDARYRVLYVERGDWFLEVRAPGDLASDEVFRVAASVALHPAP
jgi:hypothetical protein